VETLDAALAESFGDGVVPSSLNFFLWVCGPAL